VFNSVRLPRVTTRRVLAVLGAAAIALTLSGCVIVKNVGSGQLSTIGNVQITATVCVSGSTACPESGNTTVNAGNNNQNVQLLIAYRVSSGATPPATLRFTGDPGTGPLFSPDATYTAELQRLAPAPAGTQWFGYSSTLFNWLFASSPQTGDITAQFGLPKDPAGGPSVGPFSQRVVVGTRAIDAMHPISAPIACGNSLTDFNSTGSDGQTICIDSPAPATFATSSLQSTRDLVVRPGAAQTAAAGTVAALPFTLQFAGAASSSVIFGLSGTTTLPGAAPVVSPATLTPTANSTTPVLVSVPVPAGTAPGTYPVTLTASIGTQTRVATSSVTIGGGGGGGTAGFSGLSNLSVSPKRIFRTRGAQPATLSVTLSQRGTLRVAVARRATGRRNKRGRCVRPTGSLSRNGAKKCTRFISVTTITKAGLAPGVRKVTFSGRGRVPGLYRLTVTLRTAAGPISRPKTTTVTVKP
jgi:hypothetical protein